MEASMEGSLIASIHIEKEWTIEFHGVVYLVNVAATDTMLTVEAEQIDNNERWSAEFPAQSVEETTHKAGNFKKYATFVKMLCSGFSRDSESVFVDLLTYNDLELLKARKLGSSTNSLTSNASANPRSLMKRYVILTYAAEFDRVHFPLPLNHEDTPKVEALQRTIRHLRQQLREKDVELNAPHSSKEREIRQIDASLRQENTELKHRLRQLESRLQTSGTNDSVVKRLKLQNETLKRELAEATAMCQKLKLDAAREIAKLKQYYQAFGYNPSVNSSKRQPAERFSHDRSRSKSPSYYNSTGGLTDKSRSKSPAYYNSTGGLTDKSRSKSPSYRNNSRSSKSPSRTQKSASNSSSLGGRFDPTSYYLNKKREMEERDKLRGRSAWGSKTQSRDRSNSRESGYSSATSQSSNGSRRSARSNSNSSYHSTPSHSSQQYNDDKPKKKTSGKKKRKSKSPKKSREQSKERQRNSSVGTILPIHDQLTEDAPRVGHHYRGGGIAYKGEQDRHSFNMLDGSVFHKQLHHNISNYSDSIINSNYYGDDDEFAPFTTTIKPPMISHDPNPITTKRNISKKPTYPVDEIESDEDQIIAAPTIATRSSKDRYYEHGEIQYENKENMMVQQKVNISLDKSLNSQENHRVLDEHKGILREMSVNTSYSQDHDGLKSVRNSNELVISSIKKEEGPGDIDSRIKSLQVFLAKTRSTLLSENNENQQIVQ